MANHNITGKLGENLAVEFLVSHGFEILERNWKFSRAEIDIIAKEEDVLVFIEVKTRSTIAFGKPEEFVSKKQEELIIDASQRYMEIKDHNWEIRFDVISIVLDSIMLDSNIVDHPKKYEIRHYRDVFY